MPCRGALLYFNHECLQNLQLDGDWLSAQPDSFEMCWRHSGNFFKLGREVGHTAEIHPEGYL